MDDEFLKLLIALLLPFWEVVRWLFKKFWTQYK